jgi:hypothetical protein
MQELADYVYQPLEGLDQIRLLELLPCDGEVEAPVKCRLYPTTLREAENKYVAVSYAWGSNLCAQKQLICNGSKISISPNLYFALRRLRRESWSRVIWADAPCINQSRDPVGLSERSQQVRLMNKIFSNASRVVVNLGDISEDDNKLLLDCFSELDCISDEDWNAATAKFDYPFQMSFDLPGHSGHNTFTTALLNTISTTVRKGLLQFFTYSPKTAPWESSFQDPKLWASFKRFLEREWFIRV